MKYQIRFAGVGGQGNILAGEWLALAAHNMGRHAVQSPTYTAQVRGGPTSVDVLIDDDEVIFPRLTSIDFFCCLAQRGWDTFSHQLRSDSIVVVAPSLVRELGPGPQMIYRVPIIAVTKQTVGRMVYTSSVALGSLCHLMPHVIPVEEMVRTIQHHAPDGTVENNLRAFHAGVEAAKETRPVPRDEIAEDTNKEIHVIESRE
ncbi:2-oxoacid:acceptor oxidoreductase family protein [bacterium]|nr:2-oxoacid:acceptor oxidoreductase family protein [bacterium]MBU1985358.1 2-oxoacid:acceptor oxidoreductase family protein [bacterium]